MRLVAAAILPFLLLTIIGVPIPDFRPKHSTERFPCENCSCGCRTAAFCWDKCCCHTDQEKLEWAIEHGVKPPKFLVDRVAATGKSTQTVGETKSSKSCCCCSGKSKTNSVVSNGESVKVASQSGSPSASSQVSTSKQIQLKSCASSTRKSCCQKSPIGRSTETSADAKKSKVRIVVLDSLLKCHGIQMALLIFKNCLPTSRQNFEPPIPMQIEKLVIVDQRSSSIYLDADGPVPRSLCVAS